ncbi:MAG: ketopantoate reductase family protein [Pseudomonadota bacterium]
MNILVMGAGALGGYFGGRLAGAGHNVTFVARGAHLEAMQRDGLKIESPTGNLHLPKVQAVGQPEPDGSAEIVLFLVKNFDVESAAQSLLPCLNPNSVNVTLQNGVSTPQRLGEIVGPECVAPGIAFIPATVREPGVILHGAALQRLAFSKGTEANADRINMLASALREVGAEVTVSDDVQVMLWSKFVFLSALSALTTLTRLDVGPVRDTPETAALFRQAMEETAAVGKVLCPDLPESTVDEQWQFLLSLPDTVHASMLDDLNNGKPLELNYLSGDVSRLGRENGILTPLHDFVTATLQPFVNGAPDAGRGV